LGSHHGTNQNQKGWVINSAIIDLASGYLLHIHGFSMAHRKFDGLPNLKMVDLSMANWQCHHQRVACAKTKVPTFPLIPLKDRPHLQLEIWSLQCFINYAGTHRSIYIKGKKCRKTLFSKKQFIRFHYKFCSNRLGKATFFVHVGELQTS